MIWFITVYLLLSIITVGVSKPWEDYNPFLATILCFVIGGLIFILAIIIVADGIINKRSWYNNDMF